MFSLIDEKGASDDFDRLIMVREYMKEPEHTVLLERHEVAMLYSLKTVHAVYTLSEKIINLYKNFLEENEKYFEYDGKNGQQNDQWGIGYYFKEKEGKKRDFFIGLAPTQKEENFFSLALYIHNEDCEYFPIDKEFLTVSETDIELKKKFNENVLEIIRKIDCEKE